MSTHDIMIIQHLEINVVLDKDNLLKLRRDPAENTWVFDPLRTRGDALDKLHGFRYDAIIPTFVVREEWKAYPDILQMYQFGKWRVDNVWPLEMCGKKRNHYCVLFFVVIFDLVSTLSTQSAVWDKVSLKVIHNVHHELSFQRRASFCGLLRGFLLCVRVELLLLMKPKRVKSTFYTSIFVLKEDPHSHLAMFLTFAVIDKGREKMIFCVEHNLVTEGTDSVHEFQVLRFFSRIAQLLIAQVADGMDVEAVKSLRYRNEVITLDIAREVSCSLCKFWVLFTTLKSRFFLFLLARKFLWHPNNCTTLHWT